MLSIPKSAGGLRTLASLPPAAAPGGRGSGEAASPVCESQFEYEEQGAVLFQRLTGNEADTVKKVTRPSSILMILSELFNHRWTQISTDGEQRPEHAR